jgi:hypothetical protein
VNEDRVVVVGTQWRMRSSELAYVTRCVAAAASRWASVSVLAPGPGPGGADGAFDLQGMGEDGASEWLAGLLDDCIVIVDELTPHIAALFGGGAGTRARFYISPGIQVPDALWQRLPLVADLAARPFVHTFIPVNPLAEEHRHNGFGFTNYLLVLSGRLGAHDEPPPAAAWLTAAFHDANVVVVEQAVASAWRGRSLRGKVPVDSRMDLWRLLAHANTCIDLAPGACVARECVEAMRFGTPIVVPQGSGPAVVHATSGGGAVFGDPEALLQAVAATQSDAIRAERSLLARSYADDNHGDPSMFTESLHGVLSGAAG